VARYPANCSNPFALETAGSGFLIEAKELGNLEGQSETVIGLKPKVGANGNAEMGKTSGIQSCRIS